MHPLALDRYRLASRACCSVAAQFATQARLERIFSRWRCLRRAVSGAKRLRQRLRRRSKGHRRRGQAGPCRVIQTEQMSAAEMKRVIVATALFSALCSLALSVLAFGERFYLVMPFLALGGTSIYAAIRYAVGAGAYGYLGLGDVFACSLDAALLLPACACRTLSTAVLNLNNIRDIQNDALKGKRTIPVRIGLRAAKRYHYALIAGGAGLMPCYSFLRGEPSARLLYIASFAPLTGHLFSVLRVRECRDFDGRLKVVEICTFAMSALFFVGEILG